jgi:hypothetical protein
MKGVPGCLELINAGALVGAITKKPLITKWGVLGDEDIRLVFEVVQLHGVDQSQVATLSTTFVVAAAAAAVTTISIDR